MQISKIFLTGLIAMPILLQGMENIEFVETQEGQFTNIDMIVNSMKIVRAKCLRHSPLLTKWCNLAIWRNYKEKTDRVLFIWNLFVYRRNHANLATLIEHIYKKYEADGIEYVSALVSVNSEIQETALRSHNYEEWRELTSNYKKQYIAALEQCYFNFTLKLDPIICTDLFGPFYHRRKGDVVEMKDLSTLAVFAARKRPIEHNEQPQ